MSSKKCRSCNKEKPLEEFPKDARMADGHRNECNACKKERAHTKYLANRKPSTVPKGEHRMTLKMTPEYEKLINNYLSGDY